MYILYTYIYIYLRVDAHTHTLYICIIIYVTYVYIYICVYVFVIYLLYVPIYIGTCQHAGLWIGPGLFCCLVKNRPGLRQELSELRMMERPAVFSCFSGFEIIWLFGVCITRIITSPCLSTGCCWKSTTCFGVSDPTNSRGPNLAKMPINSRRKVGTKHLSFFVGMGL